MDKCTTPAWFDIPDFKRCGGWCYAALFPLRIRSRTNSRIAEDRLPCWRAPSICVTNFDTVASWARAISFRSLQKASSRLTLVLCRPITMERLTTKDFIKAPVAGLTLCQRTLIRDVPPSTETKEMARNGGTCYGPRTH